MSSIVQGLNISTGCRYIKFTKSDYLEIEENLINLVFEIKFPENLEGADIVHPKITLVRNQILVESDYIRTQSAFINLNGIIIEKLTLNDYNFSQFLVEDIDEFKAYYDYQNCKILIPYKKLSHQCEYIQLLNLIPYIKVIDSSRLIGLSNFNNINFTNRDIVLTSSNEVRYYSKKKYENYLLRAVDVYDSFLSKLSSILSNYGIQLVNYPKDKKLDMVNHIYYKITDIGDQITHKSFTDPLRYAVKHKSIIELEASIVDLILLNDFRVKYQNLDFLSNFLTFTTKDRLGRDWLSNVNWSEFPTEFNQDFSQDLNGNSAFPFNLTAELYHYVVYDVYYNHINSLLVNLDLLNFEGVIDFSERLN